MSNILAVFTKAVGDKRRVAVRQTGYPLIRVIEPYVIYVHRDGNILIDGYLRKTKAGDDEGKRKWITLSLNEIIASYLLNDNFVLDVSNEFKPKSDVYRSGLVAMVALRSDSPTISQVRKIWTHLGSAIDGVLSDVRKHSKKY